MEKKNTNWKQGNILNLVIKRLKISYRCDPKDLDENGSTPIIDQGENCLYGYTSRKADFIATKTNPVLLFTNHTCNFWFVDYPFCAIQNVIPYSAINGYDNYFVYFFTKNSIKFKEYKGHWGDFESKIFLIPPVEVAKKFSKIAKPILEKIQHNKEEIKTLENIRDTLLPKLMTGKIRVKGYEK